MVEINTTILILMSLSYIFASIPCGFLYVKLLYNQDLRTIGSKNIGCTNVYRFAGKKDAVIVFILEFIKTVTFLLIAKFYYHYDNSSLSLILLLSVLGHIFSIFSKFKGGKGIASLLSGSIIIYPIIAIIACINWLIMTKLFRYSSLSGMTSTLLILIILILNNHNKIEILIMLFITLLIFYRHKKNIYNLINSQEKKI